MSEQVFLLTITLVILAILLVFGIRAYSAIQQAKYRAASSVNASEFAEMARVLSSIDASLGDLRMRVTVIEQILKQVD